MPKQSKKADTAANLGFEAKLWAAADALLPKLISGKLRVRDAEKFKGRAA